MSTQAIDYEALAKQHGAIGYTPATKPIAGGKMDYAALAKQNGAISSQPAVAKPATATVPPSDHPAGGPFSIDSVLNAGKSFLSVFGYDPEHYQAAQQQAQSMTPVQEAVTAASPHPIAAVKSAATSVAHEFQKGSTEGQQALESAQQGDIKGALAHSVGQAGHAGATIMAPVFGENLSKAGEQFGTGDVSGGIGTTAALAAPMAVSHLLTKGKAPAAEVRPEHVEALTGLIEDRGGTVDPHTTATEALPHLRETAVRMGVDPTKLSGREAGQATLKVAEQAVRDTQNEFNTIRKPYNAVLVDQSPIAAAYRSAITPELLANAPKVARLLEKTAQKFDQPAPLEQVNQFRVRMNNQLNAFEQRGTTAQIMSDIETKAQKAATNAARDIEYSTVGRLSGLDPEYIRALKQREGSLIEAKSSLTKEYNRASGAQGEAVSESMREKLTSTFPSKHGVEKSILKNVLGPKPIDVLNSRIQKMFAGMGGASELPEYEQVQPPAEPLPVEAGPSGPVSGAPEDAVSEVTRRGPGTDPEAAAARERQAEFLKTKRENLAGQRKEVPQKAADIRKELERPAAPAPATVAGGQITPEHVAAENAFYTQARAELGADAPASDVLRRAQALKIEHAAKGAPPPVTPVPPTVRPTLTQKMQAQPTPTLRRVNPPVRPSPVGEGQSPQQQATALMLLVKQGKLSPAEADSRIQRLVGSAARRTIRRPAGQE